MLFMARSDEFRHESKGILISMNILRSHFRMSALTHCIEKVSIVAIIIFKALAINVIKRHACSDIFLINEKRLIRKPSKSECLEKRQLEIFFLNH